MRLFKILYLCHLISFTGGVAGKNLGGMKLKLTWPIIEFQRKNHAIDTLLYP